MRMMADYDGWYHRHEKLESVMQYFAIFKSNGDGSCRLVVSWSKEVNNEIVNGPIKLASCWRDEDRRQIKKEIRKGRYAARHVRKAYNERDININKLLRGVSDI